MVIFICFLFVLLFYANGQGAGQFTTDRSNVDGYCPTHASLSSFFTPLLRGLACWLGLGLPQWGLVYHQHNRGKPRFGRLIGQLTNSCNFRFRQKGPNPIDILFFTSFSTIPHHRAVLRKTACHTAESLALRLISPPLVFKLGLGSVASGLR